MRRSWINGYTSKRFNLELKCSPVKTVNVLLNCRIKCQTYPVFKLANTIGTPTYVGVQGWEAVDQIPVRLLKGWPSLSELFSLSCIDMTVLEWQQRSTGRIGSLARTRPLYMLHQLSCQFFFLYGRMRTVADVRMCFLVPLVLFCVCDNWKRSRIKSTVITTSSNLECNYSADTVTLSGRRLRSESIGLRSEWNWIDWLIYVCQVKGKELDTKRERERKKHRVGERVGRGR